LWALRRRRYPRVAWCHPGVQPGVRALLRDRARTVTSVRSATGAGGVLALPVAQVHPYRASVMQILDHDRTLLRTLPNPLGPDDRRRSRDARPAGPAPAVPDNPPPVQRRVSSRGVIMVAGQRIKVSIGHAGETVAVAAEADPFQVHNDERLLVEVARTIAKPVARFKARKPERPRCAPESALPCSEAPSGPSGEVAENVEGTSS
jgi:hypothetical protein